jgi:ankyrin repeat protein
MLVRTVRSLAHKKYPAQRPITCKYPSLADIYTDIKNDKISLQEKYNAVKSHLCIDYDLSKEEKNVLQMLSKIFLPEQTKTLLYEITQQNDPELLSIALSHGLEKHINAKDENHNTALYIATTYAYSNSVEILIQHKADVNIQNENGRTPLIGALLSLYSCQNPKLISSFVNIITSLKAAGAHNRIADNNKQTADDYLTEILEEISSLRQRTIHNELGEFMHIYENIRLILNE